jgi:hypothetical protein
MNAANNMSRHTDARVLLEYGFAELERRETERAQQARVFFNGRLIPLDTPPVITRGIMKLPLRAVFEWLGYSVEWYGAHGLALLTHGSGGDIIFFVGRNLAIINGSGYVTDAPAQSVNGRIYVTKDFIATATGTTVSWDVDTGVVQFVGGVER